MSRFAKEATSFSDMDLRCGFGTNESSVVLNDFHMC